jgi:hypothetical protein
MRLFVLVLSTSYAVSVAAADWPQFGYDQAHSGYNSVENGYSTATGNTLLRHYGLPSAADSAPIYLSDVVTATGTRNVLFVVAKNGTLLALDADSATLNLLWSKQPTGGGTLTTGSPVIDPNRQYVYAYGHDGKVHKYPVGGGNEITTTCVANSHDCWPQLSTLKPDVEKSASALAIATSGGTNYLYAAMNGYGGDGGDYQGHITTIDLASGAQSVFNMMCSQISTHFVKNGSANVDDCDLDGPGTIHGNGQMSGIWGRPGVIYSSATNRIYFATGNGIFDANQSSGNHFDWGDSVIALNPDGSGAGGGLPLDSATPKPFVVNYAWPADADLGSSSPAILPSTSATYPHLAVQGGKEGCVRLFNLDNLNGHNAPGYADSAVAPELNGSTSCSTDSIGSQIRTQPAVWVNPADGVTWFFIAADNGLYGYRLIVAGGGAVSLAKTWSNANRGTSPVIANATLYYVSNSGSPNTLRAVNPLDGATIWSDSSLGGIHWQSPIVVNGRIYVIDNTSQLWVYQLDGIFRNGFQ